MAESVSETVTEPGARVLSEIQAGDGLALSAAGRLFPAHRGEGTVGPSTVFRWVTKGARSNSGQPVKLEAVRVGGRWLTSRAAVARFVHALTDAAAPAPAAPAPRTPTARQKASERAGRELAKRGA
ncbi:DUF1580 domain-containing protein [Frigoriglobus tundricola]|uniref:DUF1580 domain-containing protein n=1 Tax=Frigoriglobus tundricola TaxID=2774151 RepID=A0A6M5YNJ0_9BACT|nr:DUF1580 domain-containing protein [Frigoriglobus tundricola]QJW95617.1 hypothetical protein FTUN_3168 [Frigoriglobus tundricola]